MAATRFRNEVEIVYTFTRRAMGLSSCARVEACVLPFY